MFLLAQVKIWLIMQNKDILQTAGHDLTQTAADDFTEIANNKTEIIEQKYIRGSLESTQHAEELTIF